MQNKWYTHKSKSVGLSSFTKIAFIEENINYTPGFAAN